MRVLFFFAFTTLTLAQGATPSSYVNPFIGTGRAGNCYPGAQAPFGLISWSPNTTFPDYESDQSRPGYKYDRNEIYGFSLTHISGVGCHASQDMPIMPVRGQPVNSPVKNREAYKSHFSHQREEAAPGYYRVYLEKPDINVELTTTEHCGVGRFTFSPGATRSFLFRPTETANGITGCQLTVDRERHRIQGWLASGGFCSRDPHQNAYRLYFVAEFDQPMSAHGFWHGSDPIPNVNEASGDDVAAFVSFADNAGKPVQMKIGLSYVSQANALMNLNSEISSWDFAEIRAITTKAWDALLGRVDVDASLAEKQTIYTALYHNFLQPSLFDDVNGEYIGYDNKAHRLPSGHHKYVNFSNWDIYRTTAQLLALLVPERASEMATSLLLDAQQGAPGGLPNWGYYNHEAFIMNGYSGATVVANLYAFGAKNFDRSEMKEALIAGADTHYERGVDYLRLGYVPVNDTKWDFSVSRTVEYAIADFGIAQFCKSLGDEAAYHRFLSRSQNVFNLLNPESKYLQPRHPDGSWVTPFSPTQEDGFNEGNSAHYTWSAPQNLGRLIASIGGADETEKRLDAFLSKILIEGWNTKEPYFWLSNEPCFGVPFVYAWLGKPWKTQEALHRILAEYNATPDGLPGDDDVGAMSAYYLFCVFGLYPEIPGTAGFVLTGPAVPRVTLKLAGGHRLTLERHAEAKAAEIYIQEVMLNGKPWNSSWITLDEFSNFQDAQLTFKFTAEPERTWASSPAAYPPSYSEK